MSEQNQNEQVSVPKEPTNATSSAPSLPHPMESASPAKEPDGVAEGKQRPVDPQDPDQVLDPTMPGREEADATVLAESRKHTRRSFVGLGAAALAGVGFYEWLSLGKQDEMQPALLRKAFETNASLSKALFQEHVLAPTYPLSRAETLRINGVYGLKQDILPESWRLQVVGVKSASESHRYTQDVTAWEYKYAAVKQDKDEGHDTKVAPGSDTSAKMPPQGKQNPAPAPNDAASKDASSKPGAPDEDETEDENHTGRKPRGMEEAGESDSTLAPHTPGLLLTLDDVLKLPRHELVTQFKCIEGWSQIVHWAGVRMADFLEAYPPENINGAEPRYVYMETPDGDYYVGYDLKALRHPQALLVTEMMGMPLTQNHGAPLRLHVPTRYGYKQIKRIALISYTNDKPDDYWTKLGYDWYAGL